MSHPPLAGHGFDYDPIPSPQEPSDIHRSLYDPPSGHVMPNSSLDDDLNPDEPSVTLVRPRFLGSIDGQTIRGSVASYDSRPQSTAAPSLATSSLYALNPDSLSARDSPVPGSPYYAGRYLDEPHSPADDTYDSHSLPLSPLSSQPRFLAEKQAVYGSYGSKSTRRTTIILFSIGGLILFSVAIVLPVYFLVVKHTNAADQHSNGTTGPSGSKAPLKSSLVTGGDGSTVMMEDGTTFTYLNSFGGHWYYDPDDPFNNGAQAQSWTPPLNQTFNYGSDRIRGYVPLLWYCHGITKFKSSG